MKPLEGAQFPSCCPRKSTEIELRSCRSELQAFYLLNVYIWISVLTSLRLNVLICKTELIKLAQQ